MHCAHVRTWSFNGCFTKAVSISRVDNLAQEDITEIANDHMILKPLNFSGHVTRLLSGWCKEIPTIDVGADLEALDVSIHT